MNHRSAPDNTSALNTKNVLKLKSHLDGKAEHIVLYVR